MESNLQTYDKIRKDIEDKLDEQLASMLRGNVDPETALRELDLQRIEEEVVEKYSQPVESLEVKFPAVHDELWASLNLSDYEDYDRIAHNLSSSKSLSTQLRTLDKLLSAYIIDTKQKGWALLSRNLQQCLASTNDEIFQRSLKIHFKIISMPNTSSEGYLNLIQSLILLFNSDAFRNCQIINESMKMHRRAISILKLILKAQKLLLKNWVHTRFKTVEEVVVTFIYMLNCSLGNEYNLGVADFLAMLDPEACWFKKFCYSLQTRTTILGCLKRTPNLLKYYFNTLLDYSDSSVDLRNHRHFLNFSHAAHFLEQYLFYPQGVSSFPLKVKIFQESITVEYFVIFIITKVGCESESPRKNVLIQLVTSMLVNHCSLALHSEVQKKLLEPFYLKNVDRKDIYVSIEKHTYVIHVINDISKVWSRKLNFHSLMNLKTSTSAQKSRERNSLYSLFHVIIGITTACIRNFVNRSESQRQVNDVIFKLAECCQNLFAMHPRSFSFYNSNRLVLSLADFYKTLTNYNDFHGNHCRLRIANFLCFYIENNSAALNLLERESKLLHDVVSDVLESGTLFDSVKLHSQLIVSIADSSESIITFNHDTFVKRFLICLWSVENDEQFDAESNKFLSFLLMISCSFKTVKALLCFENEGTVVENQGKPLVLTELIEGCLDSDLDAALGLKVIKVLITNANVLLYLLNRYKIQENLIELQVNSRIPSPLDGLDGVAYSNLTAILIDECSLLRHNILMSLKYPGRVEVMLNEKTAGPHTTPSQMSSTLKRYKSSSDLQKFLFDSKNGLHDHNWLVQLRRIFKYVCKEKFKTTLIVDLINQMPKGAASVDFAWPPAGAVLPELFEEDHHGVSIIVRFGVQNGILQPSVQNEGNLVTLLRQTRAFLQLALQEYEGFDWFIAVIFLTCYGNVERCKTVLLNIINMPVAPLLWPMYNLAAGTKRSIFDELCRHLEIILGDTTNLNCALQMLGTSARHIARKWLDHCFFTTLDFKEICNFLFMSLMYPPEYVLFFVVSVFQHMKEQIFTATHEHSFKAILKMAKANGFRISDYFNFMDTLHKQYKNVL